MNQPANISNLNQNQFLQASHQTLLMLEKSKHHVEGVLDHLPNIFAIVDYTGRIIKGNGVLASLLDTTMDQLIDLSISHIFKPASWSLFQQRLQELKDVAAEQRGEFELAADAARVMAVYSWQIRPFKADGLEGHNWYMIFGSNVTAIREYEKQLSQIFTSIPLGIVRIDEQLKVLAPYSSHTSHILGVDNLAGMSIHDLLFAPIWGSLSLQDKENVRNLSGIIGFPDFQFDILKDSLVRLVHFPPNVRGAQAPHGRWIGINYDPIIQNGVIVNILLIIEDRTQIEIAKKDSQSSVDANAVAVTRFLEAQKLNSALRNTIIEDVDQFTADLKEQSKGQDLLAILRTVHTIKGTARIANFSRLMSISHAIEDQFKASSADEVAKHSWKDNIGRFDEIYAEWLEYRKINRALALAEKDDFGVSQAQHSDCLLSELEPKLRLAIDQTAKDLAKQVRVNFSWNQVSIPTSWKPSIGEMMIHILTNAIDHGIEKPSDRAEVGKDLVGTVVLEAKHLNQFLMIVVENDGADLDRAKIEQVAEKRGLYSKADLAKMKEYEVFDLIFADKFSSKEAVTEISGRGVGLAAVRGAAMRLGGSVSVFKRVGGGSIFEIKLPLKVQ